MRPGRKYCEYFSALSYVSLVILKPLLSPSEQRTCDFINMPVFALYLHVGRRPMLIWEKQMNSASAGFMMIRTQSICCGWFRKHWVRFTVHVSLLRRACYLHKLIVMLLCFHRRYIPRGSVSCFVKKNYIAICKKIMHVYRCFDTELALNDSVYKQ